MFYNMFKITRKDFLAKLVNAQSQAEKEKIIEETIYASDIPNQPLGRRGVLKLREANKIIEKKYREKEKIM